MSHTKAALDSCAKINEVVRHGVKEARGRLDVSPISRSLIGTSRLYVLLLYLRRSKRVITRATRSSWVGVFGSIRASGDVLSAWARVAQVFLGLFLRRTGHFSVFLASAIYWRMRILSLLLAIALVACLTTLRKVVHEYFRANRDILHERDGVTSAPSNQSEMTQEREEECLILPGDENTR